MMRIATTTKNAELLAELSGSFRRERPATADQLGDWYTDGTTRLVIAENGYEVYRFSGGFTASGLSPVNHGILAWSARFDASTPNAAILATVTAS